MPDETAKIGDAYWVYASATRAPQLVGKVARPMACVAERPFDIAWSGLPRISSGIRPADEPSDPMPEISPGRLERSGAWTLRFQHSVKKSATGKQGLCEYLGPLPAPEKKKVMEMYRGRNAKN